MKFFLYGLIFSILLLPILDSLTSTIITFFEVIKSYFGVIIHKNNKKIESMGIEDEVTQILGFQAPTEEDDQGDG